MSFVSALRNASGDTLPAGDLYGGPYWAVVRDLPDIAAAGGFEASLWVASAGYGLVPAAAQLHGYSATFRSGVPDSVATSEDEAPLHDQLTAWWTALSDCPGPSKGSPRSVRDLAAQNGDSIMVLASPPYIQAMMNDLRSTAEFLADRLLLVTSYEPLGDDPLIRNIVPSQERLIAHVDGARPALHARVARHILENVRKHPLSATALRARYAKLARDSRYERPPDGQPMTDDAVRRFIRRELNANPYLTHTRLLRALRDGGRACEQNRFRNLFWKEARIAR